MRFVIFSAVFALVMLGALAASAGAERGDFMIVVPVEISAMPPAVTHGRLHCKLKNASGGVMGDETARFRLENGGFSGRMRVHIRPGGYPPGVDPVPDGRKAECSLAFEYICTSASGGPGTCMTSDNAFVPEGNPARSLFTPRPGAPLQTRISAGFDSADAPHLPRRYQ